jgi:cysteine desulfuration protein SufE
MTLDEIRADFALLDDWEDRYRYVIELGRALPPLDVSLKTEATKVRGCASQVWLVSRRVDGAAGAPARVEFAGDSDAHIVRGLVAILLSSIADKTADEILATDLKAVFRELGLEDHLTPQRSNGLASMIERVKRDVRAVTTAG